MLKNKFKKKFTFYIVKSLDQPLRIYTMVTTKKQAEEYINKKLLIDNWQDFDSWCFYQKIDEQQRANYWPKYFNERLSTEQKLKYRYYKALYSYEEISCIMRMFCKCEPIGCSFDSKDETNYLNQKIEVQNKITEELEKYLRELQDNATSDDDDVSETLVQ